MDKDSTNKRDKAIADTCGNKFIISLDFEMLDSMMPYYQSELGNRLSYEIKFNDYDRVIILPDSPPKPNTKYKIKNISLEYDIITQPDLTRCIAMEYQSMDLPYDRILRKRMIVNKSNTEWSWSLNMNCKSFKGILILFKLDENCSNINGTRAGSTTQRQRKAPSS